MIFEFTSKVLKPILDLDQIDIELLKILANNARMPSVQIAKEMKTTPRVIIYTAPKKKFRF